VKIVARRGEPVGAGALVAMAAVASGDELLLDQGGEERDAQPSGEVVVARPRAAQGVGARALAQRAHGRRRREAGHGLQQLGDLGARQRVVAVAALGPDGDEPGVEQQGEMDARRRDRDARLVGEHAGGERPPVEEREEHARARRLG
jgi:hypothetical protein